MAVRISAIPSRTFIPQPSTFPPEKSDPAAINILCPDKDERELVVRCYVNAKKQMAVCTLLHTKGDDIRADYIARKGAK